MGEYQTKESPGRIMWKNYITVSSGKHDSSTEEGMSPLPKGEWVVAKSQSGMAQDKVKFICQGWTPWKNRNLPERKGKKRKKQKCLIPFSRLTLWWILLFSFSRFMEQHGTHDIKVTDNTRMIWWRWREKLYLQIILLIIYMMEKNCLFMYISLL